MRRNNIKRVQTHEFKKGQERAGPDSSPTKITIPDTFILAALPVLGYIFHYFFEYGYLSYFNIPVAFISFNLTEMIPAIFYLLVIYFIFAVVFWPFISHLMRGVPGIVRTAVIVLPWLLILGLLGIHWIFLLSVLVGILLVYTVRRHLASWVPDRSSLIPVTYLSQEMIPARMVPVETRSNLEGLVSNLLLLRNRYVLLYFVLITLCGSIAFGRLTAMTRTSFPISSEAPGCAIVYTTAERYICKPINPSNEFLNTFQIGYFQRDQAVEYQTVTIGRLRPER